MLVASLAFEELPEVRSLHTLGQLGGLAGREGEGAYDSSLELPSFQGVIA